MRSQRKRDEYTWSEDQTTTHYESRQLRYLQRQPSSNEPSFWQLDETLELLDDDDDDDDRFAHARGRTQAWLLSSAAGSGLIAAVLFGRVLLYSSGEAHAAPPPPQAPTTELAAPQPSAAILPPSVDTVTAAPEAPKQQSAVEVSHPAARSEHPQHPSTSHGHARVESAPRDEHEHVEEAPRGELAPLPNAAPGTLRINSRPWSQVFIDERLIGNTPQLDIHLPAGSHKVRLTNPEFGMTKVFSVRVIAGETVTRVETLEE